MKVSKMLGLVGLLGIGFLFHPNEVKAADPAVYESGDCNVTIDGTSMVVERKAGASTGNMADYSNSFSDVAPWKEALSSLTSVTIDDSVDIVGKNCINGVGTDVDGGLVEFNSPKKDSLQWKDLGITAPNLDIELFGTVVNTNQPSISVVASSLTFNFSSQMILSSYGKDGIGLNVTCDTLTFNCPVELNYVDSYLGDHVRVVRFNKPFSAGESYFFLEILKNWK